MYTIMYTHFVYSNLANFQDAWWQGEIHRGPQNTSRGFQAEPTVSTFLKKQLYLYASVQEVILFFLSTSFDSTVHQ
jgi:hypothetical protein